MTNGDFFNGDKIGELTEAIINKLAKEKLTCAEAKIVLQKAIDVVDDFSIVQSLERR